MKEIINLAKEKGFKRSIRIDMKEIKHTKDLDPIEYWKNISDVYFEEVSTEKDYYDKFNKLINLLETPLTINMFIPVDEEGNVLEEPTNLQKMQAGWADNPIDDNFYKVQKYKKAQEKILFSGWEIEYDKYYDVDRTFIIHNKVIEKWRRLVYPSGKIEGFVFSQGFNTIKDLIDLDIPVTEALRQKLK